VDRSEASDQIQECCKQIALQLMKLHPAIGKLGDAETQAACVKAAHQLTVELETIKKQIIRLRKRDDSTEL
jgi:thymidylate synthase ThyX